MYKRIQLVIFCAVVCSCKRNNQEESDEKLAYYRRFLCEATAFDYCGSLYSDNDVAMASDVFAENDVRRYFLSEHGQENKSIEFFSLLCEFEKRVVCGGGGRIVCFNTVDINKVTDSLLSQKHSVVSSKERFSLYCYERNLMRLLYSVARVVEDIQCSSTDKLNFISRALPDELFMVDLSGCDWIVSNDNWSLRLKIFRNLLLVSCYMKYSYESDVWEVREIKDNSLKIFVESGNLHIIGNNKGWRLVYMNKRLGSFKSLLMNSFLYPQIIGQKVVFLSSDYSRRRTAIFRHGEKSGQKNVRVVRGRIVIE